MLVARAHFVDDLGHFPRAPDHDAEEKDGMRDEEGDEDGGEDGHRLLHATQVQYREQADGPELEWQLPGVPRGREEAESGVGGCGDGDRDGEDVVDEQRRARDDAETRAEELRRHDVPAAAEREVLDDARIGVGDDEDGEGDRERHPDRQELILPECAEGLLGPVR